MSIGQIMECLKKNKPKQLTSIQIAEWIFENYPKECLQKKRKSPKLRTNKDVINQLTAEVSSSYLRTYSWFKRIKTMRGGVSKLTNIIMLKNLVLLKKLRLK